MTTLVRTAPAEVPEVIQSFLRNGLSKITQVTYASELRQYGQWLQKPVNATTFHDLLKYQSYLKGLGLSDVTVNKKLVTLRRFFNFLKQVGVIDSDPSAVVKLARVYDDTSKDRITDAERYRLLQQPDQTTLTGLRDFANLVLMSVNGLRTGEVSKLQYQDMKQVDQYNVLTVTGKGNKKRENKLRPDVKTVIENYLQERGIYGETLLNDTYLFVGHNGKAGKHLSTSQIYRIIDGYMKAIGIKRPGITPHSLRHTAISIKVDAGCPVHKVQEFAGHADPRTTMRYYHDKARLEDNPVDYDPINCLNVT